MLSSLFSLFFFFNDTATTEIYTLSLHDALPISRRDRAPRRCSRAARPLGWGRRCGHTPPDPGRRTSARSPRRSSGSRRSRCRCAAWLANRHLAAGAPVPFRDRKIDRKVVLRQQFDLPLAVAAHDTVRGLPEPAGAIGTLLRFAQLAQLARPIAHDPGRELLPQLRGGGVRPYAEGEDVEIGEGQCLHERDGGTMVRVRLAREPRDDVGTEPEHSPQPLRQPLDAGAVRLGRVPVPAHV